MPSYFGLGLWLWLGIGSGVRLVSGLGSGSGVRLGSVLVHHYGGQGHRNVVRSSQALGTSCEVLYYSMRTDSR